MKRLYSVLLLMLAAGTLSVSAQTFQESMRNWNDGPLTWDELTLKPSREYQTNHLSFRWLETLEKTRISWNTVIRRPIPYTALDRSISWHNVDRTQDMMLRYDQLIFDLNELYHRKFLMERYSPDNTRSDNDLFSFYSGQNQARWTEIIQETQDGLDSAMVVYYENAIAKELAETPVTIPDPSRKSSFYASLYFGVTHRILTGGPAQILYMNAPGAMLGCCWGWGNWKINGFLDFQNGRLLQDYKNGLRTWKAGDPVSTGSMAVSIDYSVFQNNTFRITPFAGLGVNYADWKYPDTDGKDKNDEYAQFILLGGVTVDFVFLRKLLFEHYYGNSFYDCTEHNLALKAYVSRSPKNDPLSGWMINIGLCYNWGGIYVNVRQ